MIIYMKHPASGLPLRECPVCDRCSVCSPSSYPCSSLPPVPPRMAGFDGSAWDEEEEEPPDHQYYNDFPGKEPPLGGVVDMRLREGVPQGAARPTPPSAQTPSHLGATLVSCLHEGGLGPGRQRLVRASGLTLFLSLQPVGQPVGGDPEARKQMLPPPPCPGMKGAERGRVGCEKQGGDHCKASLSSAGRELFDDPSYVNVQNLDKARQAGGGAGPANPAVNGSAPRDLFDMSECAPLLPAFASSHLVPPLFFLASPP